jgi:hypothetical protein
VNFLKKDYPILEYDPEKAAVIEPGPNKRVIRFPECCVMTFFGDIVEKYSKMDGVRSQRCKVCPAFIQRRYIEKRKL